MSGPIEGDGQMFETVSGDTVTLEQSFAKTVECAECRLEQAGAGLIVAGERVEMHQAGAGAVVSDGETRMLQSGTAAVVTNEAEVVQSFVGVLAAKEARLDAETRVLTTWREAAIFGVVFGVVAALVDVAFRGLWRRR
jgi:hypothetical protein